MSLDKYKNILEEIKRLPVSKPGTYLHLGCGPEILSGFINIDGFHNDPLVITHDFSNGLPFSPNSIDGIYSSHSLEHLPHRRAIFAIGSWLDVLKPGGRIYLAVPDLESIVQKIIDPNIPESEKDWHYYCLFGYQASSKIHWNDKNLDHPIDYGQFHTTGFTVKRLEYLFAKWQINELFKYDGWGTPSIYLEASKI